MKPLQNINFVLSNRCNATCVWCPASRGTKSNFDMDKELVFKIIDEAAHPDFPYELQRMHMSENGEALYHRDFVEILRYIKKKLPNVKVDMLSNFGLMSKKVAEILVREKLFDSIQVNIDGHNDESYKAVKGIPFKSVMKNLKHFLGLRMEHYPDLDFGINVMPAFEYAATIFSVYDKNPIQIPAGTSVPFSSYSLVCKSLTEILGEDIFNSLSVVRHSSSGMWAERPRFKSGELEAHPDSKCPMVNVMTETMYVAPNGDFYACCLDDNQDLVVGNLKEQTLIEVWNSPERRNFMNNIKMHNYGKIGYPCNTIGACQTINNADPDHWKKIEDQYSDGDSVVFEE